MECVECKPRSPGSAGKNRKIRSDGFIPAVVYGGGEVPLHISVPETAVERGNKSFYSTPLQFKVGGKTMKVLPKEVQLHPVTGAFLHLDFVRLVKGIVKAQIPLQILNGSISKGVRAGGVVTLVQKTVFMSCPSDKIPQLLSVDVKELDVNECIRISQLQIPEGCALFGVPHQPVVIVTGSIKAEEDKVEEAEKPEEGEADEDNTTSEKEKPEEAK